MTSSTIDHLRKFHAGRLQRIVDGQHPIHVEEAVGNLLLHILPFSALSFEEKRVTVKGIEKHWDRFRPYNVMGLSKQVNFDGLLVYSAGSNQAVGYSQIFRNGVSEMCRPGIVNMSGGRGGIPEFGVIYSNNIEIGITEVVYYHLGALANLGFSPPFVVMATLSGVADAQVDSNSFHDRRKPIGQEIISFDEVTMENIPDSANATAKMLRSIFDQIANAGGRAESRHFSPEGEWSLSTPNRI